MHGLRARFSALFPFVIGPLAILSWFWTASDSPSAKQNLHISGELCLDIWYPIHDLSNTAIERKRRS
jgi:hypothetical protein